jgi:homoserine kinase type II
MNLRLWYNWRMAVKTLFSEAELKEILSNYDLGEYVSSKGFDHGADQTNIQVTTSKGAYAFRYYEKRPEDYVRFEIDLLHFLGDNSYPCPAPIQLTFRTSAWLEFCIFT